MPGHRLRHEVVKRFGDRLDVFMDIESKEAALSEYRYSIIIESEFKSYYFTEKLLDCLSVGTIPLYWGCPGITRFFSSIMEWTTLDDLERLLDMQSHSQYAKKIPELEADLQRSKEFFICEDAIFRLYPELFQ